MPARWSIGDAGLVIREGDITRTDTEALVNAANSGLRGGGGVDGAIHRAAGPELLAAGQAWVRENGPLPTGRAVITPGFDLTARWVIHTVGPVWRGGDRDEPALLRRAYDACLALAKDRGIGSIAFPAISCGVYGFPPDQAAGIAVAALAQGLEQGLVREARMYLFSTQFFELWMNAATRLLGSASTKTE